MKRQWLLWLPFALLVLLFGIFYLGLEHPGDRIIASNMVGEELPEFSAVPAIAGRPGSGELPFCTPRRHPLRLHSR